MNVQDEGSVVASIKPLQDTFQAKDLLTEKLVREYIVNRNEIVRSDAVMKERWGSDGVSRNNHRAGRIQALRFEGDPAA